MHSRQLLLAASFALLAGCKSDSKIGPNSLLGTMAFTYAGGISGTFNASGTLPTSQAAMETSSWAAAELSPPDVFAAAAVPRTSTSHDFVFLDIGRTTAGTSSISNSCSVNCGGFFVLFGQANGSGTTFLQDCFIETGTITITEITATRVRGTFTGTGFCFAPGSTNNTPFTVTNGTFDLALVPNVP